MRKIEKQVLRYLNYCEKVRGMSPVTIHFKGFVIGKFIEVTDLRSLKRLDNEMFNKWVLRELEDGVSARSLNTYNAVILAMVRYFIESGIIIPLNIRLIKSLGEKKSERKFYTREEIEKVVKSSDYVTGLMIRVMFETGMRIAELTRVRISDFQGRKVKFIGKGKKTREAYISEETYILLCRYIKEYKISDYLWGFKAVNGEPPTVNTVRNMLKEAFRIAGFEGFYPHALRHSFATNLQIKGASVIEIKEMMGHESVATTERYLHGFDGRLEELFEKYR